MADKRDDRSALTAGSRTRGRHVSQPIGSSHARSSSEAPPLSSAAKKMGDLFDNALKDLREGAQPEPKEPPPQINIIEGTPDPVRTPKPNPPLSKSVGKAPSTSADGFNPPTSQPASSKPPIDHELLQQFMLFKKMTHLAQTANATTLDSSQQQPSLPPTSSTTLHRLLQSVPKLEVNGGNFQTWVVMMQQALSSTLLRPINLRDDELVLSEMEDMLLKMALISTIDDGIKVGVAECKTGLDGFRLISDTFTLRTRTAHLAIIRDLLDLRFNHHDKSADLDSHFRKVENLVKQLTRSDFQVTEESLTGIFFQLSLPNPETYPFVNVSRQLDFRMEAGDYQVKNCDLLRIAKTELSIWRQSRRSNFERKNDRPPSSRPENTNAGNKPLVTTSSGISKWCPKCRSRDHASSDCPKGNLSTGVSNATRATTAPPRPTFTVHSAETQDNIVGLRQGDDPTIQSITAQQINPDVTQAEMDWLMKNGATLFGLDSCASHTFTNNLQLLSECVQLAEPIPLITATNAKTSFVTIVGKMTLINKSGSITINNVYFSPDATSTLLSAECLRLGGVPAIVRPGPVPLVFVPPVISHNAMTPELTCLSSEVALKSSDALLWHRRLGHISLKRIIKMCATGRFPGLPDRLTNKDFVCEDCLVSKSKRDRQRLSNNEQLQPMDIIVSDVLGPFVESFMGVKYLVKDEVCLNFQRYIERMHRLTGKKLKCFRTDGGGEFTSRKFTDWLKDQGISHQHSMPYEPEQNGAAERLHRTIGDMARTALIASGLPDKFWSFAYMWGYYTHNRIVNSSTLSEYSCDFIGGSKEGLNPPGVLQVAHTRQNDRWGGAMTGTKV
ncbi:uncharacterized protein VP01_378g8 [Puccinia sorghi]|uniref:Integrase catalytic domain-containing protein n=1 Tax=Puccinia sorghi TaxID=27349 RepID=A0A0L6UVH1_9BASI|nr:uncharacterized protein VP01_378g8 [Puccinia sorghi]